MDPILKELALCDCGTQLKRRRNTKKYCTVCKLKKRARDAREKYRNAYLKPSKAPYVIVKKVFDANDVPENADGLMDLLLRSKASSKRTIRNNEKEPIKTGKRVQVK